MYVYVLYVFRCIVWICVYCMYCLYIPVLHVYVWMVCIVCIVCICMYLHVLYVLEILYVCVCIVCICLYISKRFFRYMHIHAHTYIHTIHTKYRYVANVCMCMYFRVNTYIIQTAGFTYRQIQTCRFPDVGAHLPAVPSGPGQCVLVTGDHLRSPFAFALPLLAWCKWCGLSAGGYEPSEWQPQRRARALYSPVPTLGDVACPGRVPVRTDG